MVANGLWNGALEQIFFVSEIEVSLVGLQGMFFGGVYGCGKTLHIQCCWGHLVVLVKSSGGGLYSG